MTLLLSGGPGWLSVVFWIGIHVSLSLYIEGLGPGL